jgi:hypothetical protein
MLGKMLRTSWEQKIQHTHPPQMKKNLTAMGASCLTSLPARIFCAVFFAIFGLG